MNKKICKAMPVSIDSAGRVVVFTVLMILLLSSCSMTPKTRPHALPEQLSTVGIWSGQLRCLRSDVHDVQLALWENEQDAFRGNFRLARSDGSSEPVEYAVSGRRHQYGSLIIEPDFKSYPNIYKDNPFMISISGRLDPRSKKITASITRGCLGRLRLNPVQSEGVDYLARAYGKYDAKTQKKIDQENRLKAAQEACEKLAATRLGPMARYTGSSNFMNAPAYKGGLFVYKHTCLSAGTREAAIIYSRTAPDDQGEYIEVFSGPFDRGTQISRRAVTVLTMPQVCKIFDYSVIGGRRLMCEPYGWKYTDFVTRQCIDNSSNTILAPRALQCQLMVIGGAVSPFERGPKQKAVR